METVQSYIQETAGFAQCLTSLNQDVHRGVAIDFNGWETAEALAEIEAGKLEALIEIYRAFHQVQCRKGIARARSLGQNIGRKTQERPENFDELVGRVLRGECTGACAAKECGMPYSSFMQLVQREREKLNAAEAEQEPHLAPRKAALFARLCRKVEAGRLDKAEAAQLLGITMRSFAKLERKYGTPKDYIPENFAAVAALWEKGAIRKAEAARLCGMTLAVFNGCLAREGRSLKASRRSGEIPALFWKARNLWLGGHLDADEAGLLCGMKQKAFARLCSEQGEKSPETTAQPQPPNFVQAYRFYLVGALDAEHAAQFCDMDVDSFEERLDALEAASE